MAKFPRLFSLRNVLVLSLSLNISLLLSFLDYCKKGYIKSEEEEASVGGKTRLLSSASSNLPHFVVGLRNDDKLEYETGRVINLDHGDPTMYEKYWQQAGDRATIVIPGWQSLSYFSDTGNLCWFLEPDLAKEIKRLHKAVGNAITQDHHVVVGTGSTQLFQAALYALSPGDGSEPMDVVSAAPFYSSYPAITDCLKSRLYRWAGDAHSFNKSGPYIELVTSPNNPDGFVRNSVVNHADGILVHDLAYYWPQYTPITAAADHDMMLFTVSKSTGHAGMRIGWALVRDTEVAKKMTKFIELNTIGVSKDSQLRAAKVLKAVSDSCEQRNEEDVSFFSQSFDLMSERWKLFRNAIEKSGQFSVPHFPRQACNFLGRIFEPQPAFAWLKCEGEVQDCEGFLRSKKILTRSGKHFGFSPEYVRISMLDRDNNFNLFIQRISSITRKVHYQ